MWYVKCVKGLNRGALDNPPLFPRLRQQVIDLSKSWDTFPNWRWSGWYDEKTFLQMWYFPNQPMPLAFCLINFDSNFDVGGTKKIVLQSLSWVSHKTYQYHLQPALSNLEKASCLSISKVMWIPSSYTTPFDTLPTNQCHLPPARSTRWKLATLNELQGRKGKGN